MQLSEIAYSTARFNNLASIEAAHDEIRTDDLLDTAIQALGPIFVEHEVCDDWGLALLHKHWDLGKGEIPLQEVTRNVVPREYILNPKNVRRTSNIWPSILMLGDEHQAIHALEFSDDPAVGRANMVLARKPEFVTRLRTIVTNAGWVNLLGLAALRSVADGFELVEFNYAERVSILKECRTGAQIGHSRMETSWRFHPVLAMSSCQASCFSKCVIPSSGGSHQHSHPKAHNPNGDLMD